MSKFRLFFLTRGLIGLLDDDYCLAMLRSPQFADCITGLARSLGVMSSGFIISLSSFADSSLLISWMSWFSISCSKSLSELLSSD